VACKKPDHLTWKSHHVHAFEGQDSSRRELLWVAAHGLRMSLLRQYQRRLWGSRTMGRKSGPKRPQSGSNLVRSPKRPWWAYKSTRRQHGIDSHIQSRAAGLSAASRAELLEAQLTGRDLERGTDGT